jgi:hypothetical protein
MTAQLLLAKRLFLEAAKYAAKVDPVSCGLSISLLQDSVEMVVWALIKDKGISVKETDGFVKHLDTLKSNSVTLVGINHIHELNKARVGFKHYGNLPAKGEPEKFRGYAETFLRAAITTHFGLDFDDLSLADLVPYPAIRDRLKSAEHLLTIGDFRGAVAEASITKVELFAMLGKHVPPVNDSIKGLDRLLHRIPETRSTRVFAYLTDYLNMLRDTALVGLVRLPLDDYAFLRSTLFAAHQMVDKHWETQDMGRVVPDEPICRRQIECLVNISIAIDGLV